MNELLIRSLAGFVLILLALGTAFLGGYSFAVFVALVFEEELPAEPGEDQGAEEAGGNEGAAARALAVK